MKTIDIITPVINSKFVKTLQDALQTTSNVKVYRRKTPKRLPNGTLRPHFRITNPSLNKIQQLQRFTDAGISCPKWTTSAADIATLGSKTIFARTLINSTNGRGIIEFELGDQPPPRAPLYTAYIPKKAEYRYHVFNGQVIDVQQKKKKSGFESERNTRVRNVHNGYIYARDNISPPDGSAEVAIRAVQALGYQYGAVDLIYNERQNQCYILEVNSRPGLVGTTLMKYITTLKQYFNLD